MAKKKIEPKPHRIIRELTSEERARWKKAVAQETTPEAIAANSKRAREVLAEIEARESQLRTVFKTLREVRESKGLSLADAAKLAGMTREGLCNLENLKGNPTINTIERYAEALGQTIELRVVPVAT